MSAPFATDDRVSSMGSLNLGAGAATVVFAPGKPVCVKRVVLVTTTAQATAGAGLTFGVRNVDDTSSTTYGSGTTAAVMALNSVHYMDVAGVHTAVTGSDASQVAQVTTGRVLGIQDNSPGEIEVNVGQEFWLTSDGNGDTGVAAVYVEYREKGQDTTNYTKITATFN